MNIVENQVGIEDKGITVTDYVEKKALKVGYFC